MTCLCSAPAASAQSNADTLQLRLQIVESCQDPQRAASRPDNATQCAAPHQRGATGDLPEQLRRLVPDRGPADGRAPARVF